MFSTAENRGLAPFGRKSGSREDGVVDANVSLEVGDRIGALRALNAIDAEGRVYARRVIDWKMVGDETRALESAERLGWHSQLPCSWEGLVFWSQRKGVVIDLPEEWGQWENPLDYRADLEWSVVELSADHFDRVQHYTQERHDVAMEAAQLGERLFVANCGRFDKLPRGYHASVDIHDLAKIRERWSGTGEDGVREIVRIAEDVTVINPISLVFLARVWAGTWGLPS